MKILVTGHEGFIGRNIMSWLAQQGHEATGWEWVHDDFPDVKPYDWVIHLGAIADVSNTDVDLVLKQNFEFSQEIFTACQYNGVNLQYASSSTVYGQTKDFSEFAP